MVPGGGLLAGPLTNVVVRRLIPAGSGNQWGALDFVAGIAAAGALTACWLWLALLTESVFDLMVQRCWLIVAEVWGLGSIAWLLPLNLSMPAHAVRDIEAAAWFLVTLPFALVAVLAWPNAGRRHRVAALLAVVALITSWPALSNNLMHRAADADRAALGAPQNMYVLVDVPGHPPNGYTFSNGVLQVDYEAPGMSSPMRDTDDLLLTVCPSNDQLGCNWGSPTIEVDDITWSCRVEHEDQWQCTDLYGRTTLAARYGDLYVSLLVDPDSDTPVPASQLGSILSTLHPPNDRELHEGASN